MHISASIKEIGKGLKKRFEDIVQEPLLPEMKGLLRKLEELTCESPDRLTRRFARA